MTVYWVVVANSSYAQIFEVKGMGKEVREVQQFDNPAGRQKDIEFFADRPGRTFERTGDVKHAMGKDLSIREKQHNRFAQELVEAIRKADQAKSFDELALVAPPQFLGELKKVLPDPLKRLVSKEANKDLPASLNTHDRIKQMCECLNFWNR